jgi:hypothetical protein
MGGGHPYAALATCYCCALVRIHHQTGASVGNNTQNAHVFLYSFCLKKVRTDSLGCAWTANTKASQLAADISTCVSGTQNRG